jgi:hypothetical protein
MTTVFGCSKCAGFYLLLVAVWFDRHLQLLLADSESSPRCEKSASNFMSSRRTPIGGFLMMPAEHDLGAPGGYEEMSSFLADRVCNREESFS